VKLLFAFVLFFSSCFTAIGQDSTAIDAAKKGISKLWTDWNQARLNRDRKALEQLFAPDYVWVHGVGYMDDKTAAINDQLNTDSIQAIPVPDLSRLQVYGNVALLRRFQKTPQGSSYYTSIFVFQNNRWVFAHGQTTFFQPERKFIQLAGEDLRDFAGRYEREGRFLTITNEQDTLNVQMTRIPKRKISPVAANIFFDKLGSEYTFFKNAQGQVTHFTVRLPNNPEVQWKRVE
jgi:hypothetical protein